MSRILIDEIRGNVSLSPMFRGKPLLGPMVAVADATGGPFYCLSSAVVCRFTPRAGSRKTEEVRLEPEVCGAKPCTQRVALKGNTCAWAIGGINNLPLCPLTQFAGRLVGTSTHSPALKGHLLEWSPRGDGHTRRSHLIPLILRGFRKGHPEEKKKKAVVPELFS